MARRRVTLLMLRALPLAALLFAPSCMIAITDIEVKRSDGGEDHYEIKRRGDTLSKVEVEFGGGDRIAAARLIVFADENDNGEVDPGETAHDLGTQFDEPAEEVEWRSLRLDDEREDDSWRVRLELQSVERGSITRTIRLLPAGLLDDFDV